MFSEPDIIKMIEMLIDSIFVMLGGRVLRQTVPIPVGSSCVPLIADVFLCLCKADFIQGNRIGGAMVKHARLECGRLLDQSPIESTKRLCNWYLLHLL